MLPPVGNFFSRLILSIMVMLLLQFNSFCQQDVLTKPLVIKKYTGNLEEFLRYLKEEHHLDFSYSNDHVSETKVFAIEAGAYTLNSLLDYIDKTTHLKHNFFGSQIVLSKKTRRESENKIVISGYVTGKRNGESLIGVNIYNPQFRMGTTTNSYGFYSIALPTSDSLTLTFEVIGFATTTKAISQQSRTTLNVSLEETIGEMNEVVIESSHGSAIVHDPKMSVITINPQSITNTPSLGGEVDIMKVIQLMPGVGRGVEGGTDLYVRGGANDQNLTLLDEATVYNVGHLFGFFSVFNNDAVKDISLVKGGFSSNYGGRLSSMIDVRMKEGNMKEYEVDGGVGLLSSRLTIQGPIAKEKVSFIVTGRRSYIDQIFKLAGNNVPYYFYDLTAKINYKITAKDRVYLSSYLGNDVLRANGTDTTGPTAGFGFVFGNITTTLRWNHTISDKLFYNVSLINTRFRYSIERQARSSSLFIGSRIQDLGLKADFDWYKSTTIQYKFGFSLISHAFRPNVIRSNKDVEELLASKRSNKLSNQEYAFYGLADIDLNSTLRVNMGLRVSGTDVPGKFYAGLEPRAAVKYGLSHRSSLKLSYARMLQYMHLVSSSSISLPTDLWYPVSQKVKPLVSDQVALGYVYDLNKKKTVVTIEGYYKLMRRLIDYKEGTEVALNNNFEDFVVTGHGKAYGLECLVQKSFGKIKGWLGYTLSWSTRKFEEINNGQPFFAKYDRRHNFSIVLSYEFTKRFSFSTNWIYLSGSRFTPVIGNYIVFHPSGSDVDYIPIYPERNALKFSDSHRLDVNFIFKSKPGKKFQSEYHIGAYNVYNRASPYAINLLYNGSKYIYNQPGLFGFLPFVAYNFKF
ncbi:MAG TPA: TonB-dependent receptor [Cytophagaceae bacterium]